MARIWYDERVARIECVSFLLDPGSKKNRQTGGVKKGYYRYGTGNQDTCVLLGRGEQGSSKVVRRNHT